MTAAIPPSEGVGQASPRASRLSPTGASSAEWHPGSTQTAGKKPRLGFLGLGWIGRNRMEAIAKSGLGEIVALADALETNASEAAKLVPEAKRLSDLNQLLHCD